MTRNKWIFAMVAGVIVVCCGFGAVGAIVSGMEDGLNGPQKPVPTATRTVTPPTTTDAPAAPVAAPAAAPFGKGDVHMTIKLTHKACFGSAGANVQWKLDATITHATTAPMLVTYEVRGLEDGADVGSFTIDGDTATWPLGDTGFGSTKTCKPKLSVVVTDVSEA